MFSRFKDITKQLYQVHQLYNQYQPEHISESMSYFTSSHLNQFSMQYSYDQGHSNCYQTPEMKQKSYSDNYYDIYSTNEHSYYSHQYPMYYSSLQHSHFPMQQYKNRMQNYPDMQSVSYSKNQYDMNYYYIPQADVEKLQKIRIVQKHLIFVSGIPNEISDPQYLKNSNLFGKYGTVSKVIINPSKKNKNTSQVYVTYENNISAALAIIGLESYQLPEIRNKNKKANKNKIKSNNRPLIASYGTTKYCNYFLKNSQCPNSTCYFLHSFEKENQIRSQEKQEETIPEDSKEIFRGLINKAVEIVNKNYFVISQNWQLDRDQNQSIQGQQQYYFPSVSKIINTLISKNLIDTTVSPSKKINDEFFVSNEELQTKTTFSGDDIAQRINPEDCFYQQDQLKKPIELIETILGQCSLNQSLEDEIFQKIKMNLNRTKKSRLGFDKGDAYQAQRQRDIKFIESLFFD